MVGGLDNCVGNDEAVGIVVADVLGTCNGDDSSVAEGLDCKSAPDVTVDEGLDTRDGINPSDVTVTEGLNKSVGNDDAVGVVAADVMGTHDGDDCGIAECLDCKSAPDVTVAECLDTCVGNGATEGAVATDVMDACLL